jgi:tetratricopeptide (TPR) repeat protein
MFALAFALALAASLDGDAAFAEGLRLYDELEYEQAAFRFQEVALRNPAPGPDRARVFVYLGLSFAGAGDLDAAKRAFVDAARADRTVALPVEVSPSLQQLFDEAKASAPEEPAPLEPAPAPQAGSGGGPMPILAIVGAVGGGVLVIAGAGLAVLCGVSYNEALTAKERDATQLEAKGALDRANLSLAGAGVLIPVGLALAGVSAFLLVTGE